MIFYYVVEKICYIVKKNFFIALALLLSSCDKPSTIGIDIHPQSDKVEVIHIDTFSVWAITKLEDSVPTSQTLYNLVGSISDPVFGKAKASFCTQVMLPTANVVFPLNTIVDSIVLTLEIKSFYGNNKYADLFTFSVFESGKTIYYDSTYHSNSPFVKKHLLGVKRIRPNFHDSVYIDGKKYPPVIRIKLDNSFAKRIIEGSSQGHLLNNSTFTEFIKGIIVETNWVEHGGTIFYIDLISNFSNLTLYYRTTDNPQQKKFVFPITNRAARYNFFEFDRQYAASDFLQQLNQSVFVPTDKLYLQAMGSTKVNIHFPTIKNLVSMKPIIVNKAELIFYIDETDFTSKTFPVPAKCVLIKYNKDSSYTFLPDHNDPTFGGNYHSQSKSYRFTITRHIQNLIRNGYEDYGIALMVAGASSRADRVILNGINSIKKPKLLITYTVIKD